MTYSLTSFHCLSFLNHNSFFIFLLSLQLLILLHIPSPDHRNVLSVSDCADVIVNFCRLYRRQGIAEEEKEEVLSEDAATIVDSGQTQDHHDGPPPYSCHGPPGRKYRHGGILLRTVHISCHTKHAELELEVAC